jgi:low affinity Fe/Cu permease
MTEKPPSRTPIAAQRIRLASHGVTGTGKPVDHLSWFARVASKVAHAAGRPTTFAACCVLIVIWAASGPVFGYSDTWQLIINTSTTIVTFLMVFLIQNTQNRDGAALQAKLDELIRAHHEARNTYMGIENLPEDELEKLRQNCSAESQQ